jgi:hypothetical protein
MSDESTAPTPPHTALERIDTLEQKVIMLMTRVNALESALRRAFGATWMDQIEVGGDEPAG